MTDTKNKGGRPWLTIEQKNQNKERLLRKIEPWLMTGISVSKALRAAKIHNSELYKYMKEDRLFGEKIAHFRNFIPVLVCKIISTELMEIAKRQQEAHLEGKSLAKEDADFLFWFGTHANIMSDMYGRKNTKSIYPPDFDPEEEFQRIKSMVEEGIPDQYSHNN